jgi:hypothetical protein
MTRRNNGSVVTGLVEDYSQRVVERQVAPRSEYRVVRERKVNGRRFVYLYIAMEVVGCGLDGHFPSILFVGRHDACLTTNGHVVGLR